MEKFAFQVEESIKRHETGELINWIMNNRSRLRRLRSTLELQARMQECIEMVKQGKTPSILDIIL